MHSENLFFQDTSVFRSDAALLTQQDQKTLAVLLIFFCISLIPAALTCPVFIEQNRNDSYNLPYNFQVNINSADAAELQLLPGIGEKLSQNIIAYRQENGQFYRYTELQNIKGIGSKKLAAMIPFLAGISQELPSTPEPQQ
ncbi:hypothetical protein FACS1894214_2130 [Planctomycetales bacterium]|nr:hypothetical protein FACS1894214_2130 [Planctomycetales bacterium]